MLHTLKLKKVKGIRKVTKSKLSAHAHTHTHTQTAAPRTSVRSLQESLLDGWNELFWDVHSNGPVLKFKFGQLLTRQWLNVTNDSTILTCTTTLLLMEVVKSAITRITSS